MAKKREVIFICKWEDIHCKWEIFWGVVGGVADMARLFSRVNRNKSKIKSHLPSGFDYSPDSITIKSIVHYSASI